MGMCFWFLWSVCALWLNGDLAARRREKTQKGRWSLGLLSGFPLFYHPGWVICGGMPEKSKIISKNPDYPQLCILKKHFLTASSRRIERNYQGGVSGIRPREPFGGRFNRLGAGHVHDGSAATPLQQSKSSSRSRRRGPAGPDFRLFPLVDKPWALVDKLWALVDKLWALVDKLWALVDKPWALVDKAWALVDKLWALVDKLWALVDKLWALVDKAWALVDKPWALVEKEVAAVKNVGWGDRFAEMWAAVSGGALDLT